MSFFGKDIIVSLFGASHEAYIGITIHNFPAGIKIDSEKIEKKLKQRRGMNPLFSKRFEEDRFEIISGVYRGFTTGAPITVLIENKDQNSTDYDALKNLARPSHADYTYYLKYRGFADQRGGGVSSGRLTVALIVLGAICDALLEGKGIQVISRMVQIGTIKDDSAFDQNALFALQDEPFPVISESKKTAMLEEIKAAQAEGDSVGGIVETAIIGCPPGLGEPFFDSFESLVSHLVFSIPGVKGIEFGSGFAIAGMRGSKANDEMTVNNKNIEFLSNHSGGIQGGISNGNPIVFRTAFKPTPSISKMQSTVDFVNKTKETISIAGRHDAIIAIKGLHVVNALGIYATCELLRRNR